MGILSITTFFWVLLAYIGIVYAPSFPGPFQSPIFDFEYVLYAHKTLSITVDDSFIFIGLFFLLIEIYKAATTKSFNSLESLFSIIIAIAYLILFITTEFAHNTTFLFLTAMAFIDGLGGFIIEINAARRDVVFG
ncbi:MAG TPA: hypothetical protein EYG95_04005 [Campylobacterales bacterium]|nr:hypothetical protein [Campylobacterales bacterium]